MLNASSIPAIFPFEDQLVNDNSASEYERKYLQFLKSYEGLKGPIVNYRNKVIEQPPERKNNKSFKIHNRKYFVMLIVNYLKLT